MSDENQGSASSAEQTIPKSRLDELIAERNQERQERIHLQQTLTQLVQNQQRQVRPAEVDDPEMEDLKANNPAAYKKLKQQETALKQVRAGFSTVADQNDRLMFLMEAGADGKKALPEVERILDGERQRGNFQANRAGIYTWMLGQQRLRKDQAQPAQVQTQTAPATTEIPSTNPKLATTIAAGTASASPNVEKTREERIAELEDVQF